MFVAINPATEQEVARHQPHDHDQVEHRLARAWDTFEQWRGGDSQARATLLSATADELDRRRDDLATLMTTEMGKTLASAGAEVDKCALALRHYADHAATYLANDVIETDALTSYVRFDPLGPILAIMPWNFPLWQVFRAAAPALAAGNTMILKHASNVPGCAIAIEEVFTAAGAPEGLFTNLLVDSTVAGDIIDDQRIRGVTLTGSEAAGRSVAQRAGQALKPTVLELGGSDPFIVLDDADIESAAKIGADARLINNGESCIAAKRFIVQRSVIDEFTEAFREELASRVVGDPMDPATDVGPLARGDLRDELHDQVTRSIADGSTLVMGGHSIDGPGYYYEVTLLTDVGVRHAGAWEETFGPAAAVLPVDDDDDAVALANASPLGLGAAVWSTDRDRAQRMAGQIEAGAVFVNQLVKSDPRMPFGGVKASGYGRELGEYGIKAFTNAKTVWVE